MTTTTINPEVISPAAVISSSAKRTNALLRSFWYRTKATAAPAFSTSVSYIKGLVTKAIALVPYPVAALAAPVLLVTRFGYGLVTKALSFVARLTGRIVQAAARFVHDAINWVGNRIADFVGLFSDAASKKVELGVQKFSTLRLISAQVAKGLVVDGANRVGNAFQAPTTRGAVAVTSGAVAGVIALNAFAPASFSSVLASMAPANAATLAAISMGGWASLMPIIGVAGVATLLALVTSLFRRPKAITSSEETVTEQSDESVLVGAVQAEMTETVQSPVMEKVSLEVLEDGSIHAQADGQEVTIPADQTQEGMLAKADEAAREFKAPIGAAKAAKVPKKDYPAKKGQSS